MKPETKRQMELNYYWARHEINLEKGDEVKADFWLKKFESVDISSISDKTN